jgi:hypothetical protein
VAVFLEPALEQDHQRRLAARRRPEQQQQAPADLGAGRSRLEIIDHAVDRLVDAKQVVREQLAAQLAAGAVGAGGADHVPDILVRAARDLLRLVRQDVFHEFRKWARPMAGPVLLREQAQAFHEVVLLVGLTGMQFIAR